ncbi:MAG: PQQ-dependent dehydrogenase, methanol/ethanol family [Novosphingobium sp.]|nr:PQQ-dependent dehydrogenase, methanol/ethanol family [Novosphingobium sp.]
MMRGASQFLVAVLLVLVAACDGDREQLTDASVGAGGNWTAVGGGADESGYSRLDQIDTGNVNRLGLAWSFDLPGEVALEATPLAIDGTLYFTGTYASVYAVDGATGKLIWRYDPETWKHNPAKMRIGTSVNRGVAFADGRIFSAAYDGRLIALDAATGKPLWSVDTLPAITPQSITGAPRYFRGKVIIGNGGADYGARGFVTAYDAATGEMAWRFYTVPGTPEENKGDPAMERAAATWNGEYWKIGTGGTVWNGITFDAELDRIYLGVGNSGPYDPEVRSPGGGDNLYLTSIVALDADTGEYIWHYQINPREAWDYKATANIITATLTIAGQPKKVLMQAPTNGFFYVLDRETGELLNQPGKIGKVTWAERIDLETGRPVEAENIRFETGETTIFPGMLGAHNWQAMSFSPRSGLVYIPYMQIGGRYIKRPGSSSFFNLQFETVVEEPNDGKGALLAWDPVAQKPRWKVQHDFMWNGGTMATAGDLVFQGTADGYVSAYDANSGSRLWRADVGLGVVAAPMSYSVNGKQYVSVLVGYGGFLASYSEVTDVGWKFSSPRRLVTFALDGKASLPPSEKRSMKVDAIDDPALKLDEADVKAGARRYLPCSVCHGPKLRSPGAPAPDLRESAIALREADLWAVVHDGALKARGMPQFEELTRKQVRQIHAYIRAGARESLGLRKPAIQQERQ